VVSGGLKMSESVKIEGKTGGSMPVFKRTSQTGGSMGIRCSKCGYSFISGEEHKCQPL
jgi:uncharacterized OB-fold protein